MKSAQKWEEYLDGVVSAITLEKIQLDAYKAGLEKAAEIVDNKRGEEGDLRCVRDVIYAFRDSLTEIK